MIYRVEKQIFEDFPAFYRGVIVASYIDNTTTTNHSQLEMLFRQRIEKIRSDPSISEDHPRIKVWSEIYRKFPLKDAHKILPSVASLVRRINKGKEIPFISPLVCISNLISLTHLIPSGLVDASKVTGDLILGFAQGTEHFVPIGGETPAPPEIGEIIYYDNHSENVLCRAWNSRGGKSTFILPETSTVIIDVDGLLTVISQEEIETAAYMVASLVKEYCGGKTQVYFLSKDNPQIEISFELKS